MVDGLGAHGHAQPDAQVVFGEATSGIVPVGGSVILAVDHPDDVARHANTLTDSGITAARVGGLTARGARRGCGRGVRVPSHGDLVSAHPSVRRGVCSPAAVGAVPGGAARPGQQQMAAAIAGGLAAGEHLLVQAGTGTGKSLAYLAPALTVDGPVVVSTATLALQSQLVDHDLPRLADAVEPVLGRRPTFAVLKGRHHYLCLARLDELGRGGARGHAVRRPRAGRRHRSSGSARPAGWASRSQRLREWAMETETGDRDELDPGVDDQAWRLVSMPARECVGAQPLPVRRRSASPRRPGPGPARPTSWSPTTACSPSTCSPAGTSCRRTSCWSSTRRTSWPTGSPRRPRPS